VFWKDDSAWRYLWTELEEGMDRTGAVNTQGQWRQFTELVRPCGGEVEERKAAAGCRSWRQFTEPVQPCGGGVEERKAAAGCRSWNGQNLWNDWVWVEKREISRLSLRSLALVPVHWGRTHGEMT